MDCIYSWTSRTDRAIKKRRVSKSAIRRVFRDACSCNTGNFFAKTPVSNPFATTDRRGRVEQKKSEKTDGPDFGTRTNAADEIKSRRRLQRNYRCANTRKQLSTTTKLHSTLFNGRYGKRSLCTVDGVRKSPALGAGKIFRDCQPRTRF